MYAWQGANASFVDCTFANNFIFPDPNFYGAGVVIADAGGTAVHDPCCA